MSTTSNPKPLALVVGATGRTGKSIIQGLLESGAFRIAATGRDSTKPIVQQYREQGIEFQSVDIDNDDAETLAAALKGVDILISATLNDNITFHTRLYDAAKIAGVGLVVPNEWGPSAPEGAMNIQDMKYAVREHIRKLGLNYTVIEVGWWLQLLVPFSTHPRKAGPFDGHEKFPFLETMLNTLWGTGDVPTGVVDSRRIGELVARILVDERTLNRVVYAAELEVTANEVWDTTARLSGNPDAVFQKQVKISVEEANVKVSKARAAYHAEKTPETRWPLVTTEYAYSKFIRGDNTRANAVKLGSLDALELYPDYKPTTLEEYVERFYAQ